MASVKQAWIKKYGEEEGLRIWNEHCTAVYKNRFSLNWFIDKYGETIGPIKYKEHCSKLSVGYDVLKARGRTEEEIQAIKKRHSDKSKNDLETFIKRYGDQEGKIKYEQYCRTQQLISKRTLEYWLKETNGDKEKAIQLLSDYQRRDLNWYIAQFGEIDGHQKFQASNKKKGRTLENYINKYGIDEGYIRYANACKNNKDNQSGCFDSKGQLEVEEYLRGIFDNVKGARNETGIILTEDERSSGIKNNIMYPDMIVNDKVVVNYHGDFYHANPEIYKDPTEIIPRIKKSVHDIHRIDFEKDTILRNRGYFVITVWESEWYRNKNFMKTKLRNLIDENS